MKPETSLDEFKSVLHSYAERAVEGLVPCPEIRIEVSTLSDIGHSWHTADVDLLFDQSDERAEQLAERAMGRLGKILDADGRFECDSEGYGDGCMGLTVDLDVDQSLQGGIENRVVGEVDEPMAVAERHRTDGNVELSAGFSDWPALEPGKPTRVVACGLYPKSGGEAVQPYWNGEFDDLSRAQYWGAKKEREFKSRKFGGVSTVYWQHDITLQQAVDRVRQEISKGH